jgi:hypothetical protein
MECQITAQKIDTEHPGFLGAGLWLQEAECETVMTKQAWDLIWLMVIVVFEDIILIC